MKIAVGFFDGVHIGHQAILDGADAAITFSNHPISVLAPERAPALVMREEDRFAAIRSRGIGDLTVLDFTADLARLEPEDFAARYLRLKAPTVIRCGENWRFGRNGKGDAEFLRGIGFDVEVVPFAVAADGRVSSSRIRAALADGRVTDANAMLGHPFALVCRAMTGKGLGTKMGFPTVNLIPLKPAAEGARLVELPHGVYAVQVAGARCVANWGVAPTMGAMAWKSPVLEVHFLETFSPVSDVARVEFLKFIRPERAFNSIDALKAQIALDIADCELSSVHCA